MTNNFHIRKKNANQSELGQVLDQPLRRVRPPALHDGSKCQDCGRAIHSLERTPSFLDGCGCFCSRPWSVPPQKRLTLDHMGPPFGRETDEKRLNLKVYTSQMMVSNFGRMLPELSHRLAHINIHVRPFLNRLSNFIYIYIAPTYL